MYPPHNVRQPGSGVNSSRRRAPLPKGWARIRATVARDADYICQECFGPAPVKGAGSVCDHIKPAAEGGTDDMSNLQWLCKRCSDRKTAREANRFKPQKKRPTDRKHPGLQ